MSDILNKAIVLRLNKSWQAIGWLTVKEAVVFLASERDGEHPGFAMDYSMVTDENGEQVLSYTNPVPWDVWVTLPVRDSDLAINTARGQIRAPLVVVCANYNKIPLLTPRASAGTIFERDAGTCQYTGKKLPRNQLNLDHVIPKSRGGRDTFENLVMADKAINTFKGARTPEEAGLKLIRKPKAPPSMPVIIKAEDAKHPAQKAFLL